MAETMGWLGMIGLGAAAMGGMGYLANGRWTGVVGMGAISGERG